MLEPQRAWIVTALSRDCKKVVGILCTYADNWRVMRGIVWALGLRGWVGVSSIGEERINFYVERVKNG
jgi:hypothetical protein